LGISVEDQDEILPQLDEEEVGAATEKKDKLIRGGEKRFCQSD
jgi:hypothetical protein